MATTTRSQRRIGSRTSPAPGQDATKELMRAALGFKEISLDIPDTATLEQMKETLGVAVEGYKRLQGGMERIKPLIGRILLAIQQSKKFRPTYTNFTEFLDKVVVEEMGFGRSTAFDALRIARAFPGLTSEQYQNYGATRLLYAARVTSQDEPDHMALLDHSTQVSTDAFKEEIDTQLSAGRATPTTVTTSMRLEPETKNLWDQLLASTELSPNDLLIACMHAFKNAKPGHASRRTTA